MRSDDDMPGEGLYELYCVLFCPGLHERSADRMRDVRREQRAFAKWGPVDRKPLLEAATLADGLAK